VLITRCAWHRGYHGHPALIGITDWRGLRLGFSDGICSQCAAQLRADLPDSHPAHAGTGRDVAGWMPGIGLVVVAVMAVVLLVARPVHEPPDGPRLASALPGESRPSIAEAHPGGVVNRRGHSHGVRSTRSRVPVRTAWVPRGPSQSP
jgi:hypothetical protein